MNSVFFVAALAAVEDLPDEVRKAVVRQMSTALPEAGAYSLPEAAYQLLLVALAAIPLKLLAYSLTVYTVVQVVAQARLTDQHAHQAAWLGAAVDMGIFGALLGLSFMTDEADLARLLHVYATLNLTCGILRAVYFLCMPGATRSRSLRPATPSEYDEYFAETPPAATEFQGAVRVCQFYAGQKGHALHHRVCELLSGGTAFASTADRWFTQLLVNEFAESEQAILQVHAVRTRDGRVWARLFVVLLTLLYQRSRLFYLHHGDQAGAWFAADVVVLLGQYALALSLWPRGADGDTAALLWMVIVLAFASLNALLVLARMMLLTETGGMHLRFSRTLVEGGVGLADAPSRVRVRLSTALARAKGLTINGFRDEKEKTA